VDKVIHMQDRIKSKLGVDSTYRGPDPACMAVDLVHRSGPASCEKDTASSPPGAVGHEFEFLGTPHDYPECRYCWIIEENEVLMWIVLPHCSPAQDDVTLAF
jgi:hypothetical protein